ncbi:MAG: molybdopterin-dependent oxidoreductase, partial [Proteobacteria bacterium]|nr:molybdopterin-dependent oxidoreductase [Pseudomonadota bacterium]
LFQSDLIYTNNTYCQAMRGYGNPEVTWAIESNLDQLAEISGIDRLDLRRINCNQSGDLTPMGLEISSCGLSECLEKTAEKLDFDTPRGKRRGVGLASLIHVGGSGRIYQSDASGIILRFDDFGNLYTHSGGVEMGQGLHAALAQSVADAVGVRPERVFIVPTDTATCPWDVGTHASRGAFVACNAAIEAAGKLRTEIFAHAARFFPKLVAKSLRKHKVTSDFDFSGSPEDFELRDGLLFHKNGPQESWAKVDLAQLIRTVHFRQQGEIFIASAFYDPPTVLPDWSKGYGHLSATYAFGTQGVEVEVDVDTGDVKILRMVACHDVGRVLNPKTLAGQCYGALAQGLGYSLYEEVLTEEGRVLNPSFTDYKIPTAVEMGFPIDLVFVETDDEFGPFGSKGVGEPGLVPTAPAIANAIYDAIGVRIYDLPITPQKIVAAIKEQG